MKKSILAAALAAVVLISGCSGESQESDSFVENISSEQVKNIIDYGDAESFEKALNEGKNLEGKIVCFVALEYHPNSAWGYNLWAGEHLNFVSSSQPDIKEGDTVIAKVITVESHFGSWIINYEKVENAVANDNTVISSKDNSTQETNESSKPQTEITSEQYKKENFIVGATKYNDWYYKEKESGSIDAVLYVGDFADIDDVDAFVANFYTSLYQIIAEAPYHGLYMYSVLKENGDVVAGTACAFGTTASVVWKEDYKPLNDNENAKFFDDLWSQKGTTTSQPSSSSQPESSIPPVQNNSTYTSLYDDQFVNISFCGIEKYAGKESVVYIVENKNDFALHVWDPTVALDGIDLGKMTGMYDISPKSKGKVYFYKDNKSNIENKNPSTVSGSLTINSKGNEKINGQTYYEISFSGNVS